MERLSDYDYEGHPELIAQTPLADRSASRLLALDRRSGAVQHLRFADVVELLRPGDLLVVNETRVTAVRLYGRREDTGGAVELLVLRKEADGAFACLAKPGKRLKPGVRMAFDGGLGGAVTREGDEGVRFVFFNEPDRIAEVGLAPLPPYIKRPLADKGRYQTVYARAEESDGSAAAPTAGLHFTAELLGRLRSLGIGIAKVDLTVGLDTFRPVQAETLEDHVMHGERCSLPPATAEAIAACVGRVVAVGTTTVRTLETFARLPGATGRRLPPGDTVSKLFLRPGSEFKVVDAMFTNFHMPRTTMLVMLSAFADREKVLAAYDEAVRERYRLLSFGDSMFVF